LVNTLLQISVHLTILATHKQTMGIRLDQRERVSERQRR
jgi:hypothetical protein